MSRTSYSQNQASYSDIPKQPPPPQDTDDNNHSQHHPEGSVNNNPVNSNPNALAIRQIRSNKFTLTFLDHSAETDYEHFFLLRIKGSWRRSLALLLFIVAVVFVSTLVKYHPSTKVSECQGNPLDFMNNNCPIYTEQNKGFCGENFGDVSCVVVDSIFWITGFMLPIVFFYVVSLWLSDRRLGKYIHYFTGFISVTGSVIGFGARYYFFQRLDFFYISSAGLVLYLYIVHILLRARFILALVSYTLSCTGYLILVGFSVLNNPDNANAFGVMAVILVSGAAATCFSCYETEVFFRAQFLTFQQLMKTNAKLTQQLKVLQKGYTSRAADFESPLEKSLMVIKSMQADSTMNANHLSNLAYLIQLLTSPNLLTPDLEGIAEGGVMDNEQEVSFVSCLLRLMLKFY
jgi:hypothetical protein